jgi:hypothetical protein
MSAMNNQKIAVLRGSALPGITQGGTFLAFSLFLFFSYFKMAWFQLFSWLYGPKKV